MIPSHYRCRSNRLLAATSSLSTWKLGGLDQGQAAEQTNPRFAAMVFGISSNQFEPLVLTTLCQFQKLLFEQSIRPQLLQSDTSDCRKHPFAQMIPSHYRCRSNRLLAATSSLSTWKLGGLDQGQAAEQTNPRFAAMVFGISSNQFEPLVLTTLCQFQKLLFEQSIEQSMRPQLLQSDTSDCRKHPFAQMIPSHYRCRSNRLLAATSSLSTWKLGGLNQGQAAEPTSL